jgi:intracellular sulfur oxidation DsrE/DsrF family protein
MNLPLPPHTLAKHPRRQRRTRGPLLGAAVVAFALLASAAAQAQDKVVYHINDTATQALAGLRNVRNHLDTDPTAQITVVTHAQGVDFLMEGAKGANDTAYEPLVAGLKSRGVKFEVCEITLKNRNLKKEQFIQEADFTPSGVVRATKLQMQGYAYLKP